jgi:hypothetical protein
MPNQQTPNPASSAADRIARAARISLVCPFLVVLMALIASRLEWPYRIVAELGAGVLALTGLICGIAALARGRRSAGSAVAIQGGIGLVISLVFVGIVLNNYLRAQPHPRANQKPAESLDQSGMSPEAQRLAEALAHFVLKTTELEQRMVAASKPLGESPVLELSGVDSVADLAARRSQVEDFLKTSHALSNHLSHSQTFIELQLVDRGTPAAEANALATAFLKNIETQLSDSLQLRGIEHDYSQTLLQALDLLKARWGAWKTQAEGAPLFEDEAATRQYAALQQRLDELETRGRELKEPPPNL